MNTVISLVCIAAVVLHAYVCNKKIRNLKSIVHSRDADRLLTMGQLEDLRRELNKFRAIVSNPNWLSSRINKG